MQTSDDIPDPQKVKGLPLSPRWQSHVEEWIEAEGIQENAEHFPGKVFRQKFFPVLARVFFDELVEHTRIVKKVGDVKVHVVEELGLHASTLKKWTDESHPPGADKFFAVATLVLKKDIRDLPLSDRRALLFEAVKRQMELFAADFCEPPECDMTRTVFRGVMHAMRQEEVNKLYPGEKHTPAEREKALAALVVSINERFAQDYEAYVRKSLNFFAEPPQATSSDVAMWIASWGVPYTLLAIGTKDVPWEMDDA